MTVDIEALLARMTWEQKLLQLQIVWRPSATEREALIRRGIGSTFWPPSAEETNTAQRIAVEETELGIPLLVGLDVIHGQFTIFPTPLAQAAAFDPAVAELDARVSATEARSAGVNWTFSPMVDVTRDPRWGRVVEGFGEDPYLSSVLTVAKVAGYQGRALDTGDALAACLKHFVAYGAAEAGPRLQHHGRLRPPPPRDLPRDVPSRRRGRSRDGHGGVQLAERHPDACKPRPADRGAQGAVGIRRRGRRRRGRRRPAREPRRGRRRAICRGRGDRRRCRRRHGRVAPGGRGRTGVRLSGRASGGAGRRRGAESSSPQGAARPVRTPVRGTLRRHHRGRREVPRARARGGGAVHRAADERRRAAPAAHGPRPARGTVRAQPRPPRHLGAAFRIAGDRDVGGCACERAPRTSIGRSPTGAASSMRPTPTSRMRSSARRMPIWSSSRSANRAGSPVRRARGRTSRSRKRNDASSTHSPTPVRASSWCSPPAGHSSSRTGSSASMPLSAYGTSAPRRRPPSPGSSRAGSAREAAFR